MPTLEPSEPISVTMLITARVYQGSAEDAQNALSGYDGIALNNNEDGDITIDKAYPFAITDEMVDAAYDKLWGNGFGYSPPINAAPAKHFIGNLQDYGYNAEHPDRLAGLERYKLAQITSDKKNREIMRDVLNAAFASITPKDVS